VTLNDLVTLNGVIALILRYFTEFDGFEAKLGADYVELEVVGARPVVSVEYRLPLLAKTDLPCSAVSLR